MLPLLPALLPALLPILQSPAPRPPELVGLATTQPQSGAAIVLATAIIKNMVGAGIFALSAALSSSRTGVAPGIVLVFALAAMSANSFYLLASTAARAGDECLTTEGLWRSVVGSPGAAWIAAITTVQACGTLVQYSATLAELLGPAATWLSRRSRLLLVALAMLPLCLAEDLEALKYSSSLGLGGVVYAVLFVCWRALDGSYAPTGRHGAALAAAAKLAAGGGVGTRVAEPVSAWAVGWRTFSLVGVLNTAYFAHLNVPAYWRAWQELRGGPTASPRPATSSSASAAAAAAATAASLRGFRRVVAASFALPAVGYALVLVMAARTFGTGDGDSRLLLLRYAEGDTGAAVLRLATIASVATAYPLTFHAVRDLACAWLARRAAAGRAAAGGAPTPAAAPKAESAATRRAVSVALLALLTALALGVENLTKFLAVRGALLASLQVYAVPAILALAARCGLGQRRLDAPTVALCALCLYGVVSSGAGTVAALR